MQNERGSMLGWGGGGQLVISSRRNFPEGLKKSHLSKTFVLSYDQIFR